MSLDNALLILVPPMDTQTVIALCAIFTVVIGIVGLANRN